MRNIVFVLCLLLPSYTFAIKITDAVGRVVDIKEAKKIVPLSSTLRFLTYMGVSDRAVATEAIEKRDMDSRPYTLATAKKSALLPVVAQGGAGRNLDIEKVVALKPDVILTSFIDRQSADSLSQKSGIAVIVLSSGQSGYDEATFFASLRIVGEITKTTKKAEGLIRYIKSLDAKLEIYAKAVRQKPKVYIGGVANRGQHGIGSTEASFFGFDRLGLKNVVDAGGKRGHLFVDREFILRTSPDIIYVDGGGYGNIAEEYAKDARLFELMPSVRSAKVFLCFPSVFYGMNVETMYANAFFYAKTALGIDIDPKMQASEIFKTFVGADTYNTMAARYGGYSRLRLLGGKITKEEL